MKVLLDECVPRKFKHHLPGHECHTVPEAGLGGQKNGELLSLAEQMGFQAFLTLDQGIEYEQNLTRRRIAVIVKQVKSSRLADLLPQAPEALSVLRSIRPGQLVHVR
jgi:Domain of unknown function (DUF5615)